MTRDSASKPKLPVQQLAILGKLVLEHASKVEMGEREAV